MFLLFSSLALSGANLLPDGDLNWKDATGLFSVSEISGSRRP